MLTSIIKKAIGLLSIVTLLSCSTNFYFNEVVYNSENGDPAVSIKLKLDKKIVKPKDPVLKGFIFLGWYEDKTGKGEPFTFDKLITSKTVLYAVWENKIKYLASFEVGSASSVVKAQVIQRGKLAIKPFNNPERAGYVFQGWYTNSSYTSLFDFNRPILADTTIYARWDPNGRYTLKGNTLVKIDNPRTIEYIPQRVNNVEITAIEGFEVSSVRKYSFLGENNTVTNVVVLPSAISVIGDKAFEYCAALRKITFGGAEIKLESNAFSGCIGLVSLEMPNSIRTIGPKAFFGCSNLKKVNFSNEIIAIGTQAFENCRRLSSIKLPEELLQIGDKAFFQCVLLQNVEFKNKIQNIGRSAFAKCTNLINVIIKDKLNAIGDKAFEDCRSITKIELPNTLATIGEEAFIRLRKLEEFIITAETPPTLGNNVFSESKLGFKIKVPATRLGTYKNTTGWDTYKANIFTIE